MRIRSLRRTSVPLYAASRSHASSRLEFARVSQLDEVRLLPLSLLLIFTWACRSAAHPPSPVPSDGAVVLALKERADGGVSEETSDFLRVYSIDGREQACPVKLRHAEGNSITASFSAGWAVTRTVDVVREGAGIRVQAHFITDSGTFMGGLDGRASSASLSGRRLLLDLWVDPRNGSGTERWVCQLDLP